MRACTDRRFIPPTFPPLPKVTFSSVAIWITSQDHRIFKSFSSLPCRTTKPRPGYHWPTIRLPSNSRIANQSSQSPPFSKSKHRPSMSSEKAIKYSSRSRVSCPLFRGFLPFPPSVILSAWYVSGNRLGVFNMSDAYSIVIPTCACNTYWARYPTRCTYLLFTLTFSSL